MNLSSATNAEVVHCVAVAGSNGPSQHKSYLSKPYPCKPNFICFSQRFQTHSTGAADLRTKRIINRSSVISNSKRSDDGEGLTYKDAGVDIDAGSELVRRISKMVSGIGGFGGLYPLGIFSIFS
uniref:Uncharacterized protein n=1 Tax=Nelumbo nucifera TaxID=4432 RepID=A0A822YNM5_NELNU|nr:TPA_asm: hypothetical protein HUJ06_012022 [Nelumbo nucifera]